MSLVKNALKAIFPRVLLKKAFSVYNQLRIRTIDRILFPEYHVDRSEFTCYRQGHPFRESNITLDDIPDATVVSWMQNWFDWTQEEFILHFRHPCYVEPDFGWAIVPPNRLLYFSLGISRTPFQKKPAFVKWIRRKQVTNVQKAISLRDTGEENYFHFYNDVLSKLFFLEKNHVAIAGVVVIISHKLWNKSYFQSYYQRSPLLQSLSWIIQDSQYIRCEELICCKPLTHRKDLLTRVFAQFAPQAEGDKKIFVTRSPRRLRHLVNTTDIELICQRHGFDIVDCDHLSLEEQAKIFSRASFIAGIHGAGLTNIYYRNARCFVFEIFPPADEGYLPFHYIMLAKMKGFQYDGFVGKHVKGQRFAAGFYVDPDVFETRLLENLARMAFPG